MQASVRRDPNMRTRKRLATRQAISDAATRLFMERGFDRVTIDEIAAAADVGRMTVFNHFPRKEDMFFDREQEIRDIALEAVRTRDGGVSPIEAMRLLAHSMVARRNPSLPLYAGMQRFVQTAMASEALKARARQLRDDFVRALAAGFAESLERPSADPQAHLAAALIATSWSVAFAEAHVSFDASGDAEEASRRFLALIDRGAAGTEAALAGTAYA